MAVGKYYFAFLRTDWSLLRKVRLCFNASDSLNGARQLNNEKIKSGFKPQGTIQECAVKADYLLFETAAEEPHQIKFS